MTPQAIAAAYLLVGLVAAVLAYARGLDRSYQWAAFWLPFVCMAAWGRALVYLEDRQWNG